MESAPFARDDFRASGANWICSNKAWRLVALSFVLLLGASLANQSSFFNAGHDHDEHCEGNIALIANGVCDISVNTAACGFDGGDCCECTCVASDGSPCNRAEAGFSCRDPNAPVNCDSMESRKHFWAATYSYPKCAGYVPQIRDGRCDEANNNADCGFDGGDCCARTCIGGLAHVCGGHHEGGFDCRDPHVIAPRRRLNSESCTGLTGNIGDTRCDRSLNNFECEYDGGDCCECTCAPSLLSSQVDQAYIRNFCSTEDFDCIDPRCGSDDETPAVNPTPGPIYVWPFLRPTASPVARPIQIPVVSPTPITASSPIASACTWPEWYIGDGDCDDGTNNLECNWDGGDCCECTCQSTESYQCPDFDCRDPYAATDCESESYVTDDTSAESPVPSPTDRPVPSPSSSTVPHPTELPVPSPIYVSPVPSPTASPLPSPVATSEPDPTASPVASPVAATEPRSTASPVASPVESREDNGGIEVGGVSTSSATLTATTAVFELFQWEVVGVLSSSVLGYFTS